mmetsp:Transcript_37256/g.61272  ORF Transcript_37256/g.61272 Transcript_37256/m.61272 type:complete len:548 (-) Transcript_37256:118-1761(-)
MAWTFSSEVIDLYIQQYMNGTTTYSDDNGTRYLPIDSDENATPPILAEDSPGGVLNAGVGIEEAIIFTVISLILVIMGGITSGLNVSLLSIDAKKNELLIRLSKANSELLSGSKRMMMEKLQPLIRDKHLLLVTLLVANASCMEALPIFLDKLVASWLAVIISVTFVLIFGEILPQAMFSADPLKSGYKLYPIVFTLKWLLFPLCKPLAWLLDCFFAGEAQQKGIVFTHKEINMIMTEISRHPDEKTVVEGALKIADYTVMESVIPWKDVLVLDAHTKLDTHGLRQIYKTGFSRIPIYEHHKDNIIGILLVKTLIICDPDPNLTVKEYLTVNFKKIPTPALVLPTTPLYDCLNLFQERRTHFAMVCEHKDEIDILESWRDNRPIPTHIRWVGIITLEDIMEDIIQEQIADEFDPQTPMQAILQAHVSKTHLQMNIDEQMWTEDRSFVESVKSRFSAKNKRTQRASKVKNALKNRSKVSGLMGSEHAALSPVPMSSNLSINVFDNRSGSHSQPELLSKPLLMNDTASLNVPNNQYGKPISMKMSHSNI